MTSSKPCNYHNGSSFLFNTWNHKTVARTRAKFAASSNWFLSKKQLNSLRVSAERDGGAGNNAERRTFLTMEEAGLIEVSGLSTHERFLCRLTISSLNLLRVVAEQEGCSIEELNAGKLCDWFLKDKLKREQNLDSAVLQWDDSELQF